MIEKYCYNLEGIRFPILMALLSETKQNKKIMQGNQKRSIFLLVSLDANHHYLWYSP